MAEIADSDVPSMPETPGRDLAPISEAPQNILSDAASTTLQRFNEEGEDEEEEEKIAGLPAPGEKTMKKLLFALSK